MPHGKRAFEHFDNGLTAELSLLKPESLIYIGWRDDCHPWWYTKFIGDLGIQNISILEIFSGNFNVACHRFPQYKVIHGDARKIEEYYWPDEYDLIFWDHGPEHIPSSDLASCTEKLYAHAKKALIYCCPWGNWPQGAEGGNEFEAHYDVNLADLERMGMSVACFGSPGQEKGGELIAVRTK